MRNYKVKGGERKEGEKEGEEEKEGGKERRGGKEGRQTSRQAGRWEAQHIPGFQRWLGSPAADPVPVT